MSGCFGGSAEDRYFERKLNEHLDRKAADEEGRELALERVAQEEGAEHIGPDKYGENLFEREDGTRFRVTSWPEREPDFDRDEETGKIYPSGWTWGNYEIEEETEFRAAEDEIFEELAKLRVAARAHAGERVSIGKQIAALRHEKELLERKSSIFELALRWIDTNSETTDWRIISRDVARDALKKGGEIGK